MAVSLVTTPTYALPSEAVTLTATISGGTGANFVRVWCVDAPLGSIYRKQLDKSGALRVEITPPQAPTAGGILPDVPFSAQLDKGGKYTFVAQEYTLVASSYGGGYSNSPDAYTSETKIGAEQTVYVYLGERLTQRLGASSYGTAQLLVYVWNGAIRSTSVAVHGVFSPDIINASTPRALSARANASVKTQLAAFNGLAASALAPNLQALLVELRADVYKHMENTGAVFHRDVTGGPKPDTDNSPFVLQLPGRCTTPAEMLQFVSVLHARLRAHMSNGVDGTIHYHTSPAASHEPDYLHAVITDSATNVADLSLAYAALADLVWAYENHRVDATSHVNADTFNPITTALGPLLLLHQYFLVAMRGLAPTANDGVQTATVTMTTNGFRLE